MVNNILTFMEKNNLLNFFIEEWKKNLETLNIQNNNFSCYKNFIIKKAMENNINFIHVANLLYKQFDDNNEYDFPIIKKDKYDKITNELNIKIIKYILSDYETN